MFTETICKRVCTNSDLESESSLGRRTVCIIIVQ